MRISSVGQAFPANYYEQDEMLAALKDEWAQDHFNPARLERLHRNVLVGGRHLALPIEEYDAITTWGESNDAWIRVAREVGGAAIRDAVRRCGLSVDAIDTLITVTVTGVATPSLDARLVNDLGLSTAIRRVPIFGLGCVAGAAGLARASDFVRAFPREVAVLLSVELCSLTLQRRDLSIPNLIASGLFGDGAAAVVVAGEDTELGGPRIVASRSVFYPDSERVMGWDISEKGFELVLSAEVPAVVERFVRRDVDAFLADNGLQRSDVARWICHPGGPKVLQAMQTALELDDGALEATWRSLREVGNLSSTSVLLVLREALDDPLPAGSYGVVLAMGPGFCSELVLIRW